MCLETELGGHLELGRKMARCTAPEGIGMPTVQKTTARSSSKICALESFSACRSLLLERSSQNGTACDSRREKEAHRMASNNMSHFMSEDCRNFLVSGQQVEEASVDDHFTTW